MRKRKRYVGGVVPNTPCTDTADAIKRSVARYFNKKRRAVYYEIGLNKGGRLRADVLVLAMNGHVVIVEVKSSKQDFLTDKKMEGYLDYCNQFYLAIPSTVYKKVKGRFDIEGAGVFLMSDDGTKIEKVLRAKNYDIEQSVSYNLAIRAAFRNSDTNNRKNVRA